MPLTRGYNSKGGGRVVVTVYTPLELALQISDHGLQLLLFGGEFGVVVVEEGDLLHHEAAAVDEVELFAVFDAHEFSVDGVFDFFEDDGVLQVYFGLEAADGHDEEISHLVGGQEGHNSAPGGAQKVLYVAVPVVEDEGDPLVCWLRQHLELFLYAYLHLSLGGG